MAHDRKKKATLLTRRLGLWSIALGVAVLTMGADNQGCQSESSNDVAQDEIHAVYWLYYDTNADTTYARAQFRFGSETGTSLELEEPASVSFEGKPMGFNELLDWHEVVVAGRVDGGTFSFTNSEGETFENIAPPLTELDISSAPDTLDRSQSFELVWSGPPVLEDELFETIVANAANNFDFIRVDQRTEGATSVVIPKTELDKLPAGAAVLGVRRHRDFPLVESTEAGGKLVITFQPLDQPVTLQ
jgi:hypothetical protein